MEEGTVSTNFSTPVDTANINKETMAVAKTAMVVGIVSLCAAGVGDPAGIVLAIIGLNKAKTAKRMAEASNDNSFQNYITTGRITSTIGLILCSIITLCIVLIYIASFLLGMYIDSGMD